MACQRVSDSRNVQFEMAGRRKIRGPNRGCLEITYGFQHWGNEIPRDENRRDRYSWRRLAFGKGAADRSASAATRSGTRAAHVSTNSITTSDSSQDSSPSLL